MLFARNCVAPVFFILIGITTTGPTAPAQKASAPARIIPKTWDDQAIATLEFPLADPVGSPKHASADYYYRIPVAPIYKNYAVYVPGNEPPGYIDWLKQQEPEIVWDDSGHAPPLKTDQDWIRAGEIVFDAPVRFGGARLLDSIRNPSWYEETGTPHAKDGTLPIFRYVIVKKGMIEVGQNVCGYCHSRLMPDGSVLKGGQGNFPLSPSAQRGSVRALWALTLPSSAAPRSACHGSTRTPQQLSMDCRLRIAQRIFNPA
jgi:hypothetical protein